MMMVLVIMMMVLAMMLVVLVKMMVWSRLEWFPNPLAPGTTMYWVLGIGVMVVMIIVAATM